MTLTLEQIELFEQRLKVPPASRPEALYWCFRDMLGIMRKQAEEASKMWDIPTSAEAACTCPKAPNGHIMVTDPDCPVHGVGEPR